MAVWAPTAGRASGCKGSGQGQARAHLHCAFQAARGDLALRAQPRVMVAHLERG